MEDGRLVAVKQVEGDPVARVIGFLEFDASTDAWLGDVRDRR